MGLVRIHGSLLPSQNFQATFGVNSIQEELLIEMSSPLERQTDVVNALPVFGQAGPWTFTIGISTHPYRTDLILKSCDGVREAPDGRPFWIVSVTYESAQWLNEVYAGEDRGRGNVGRKKKIDNNKPIIYPWDEPPTWSASSQSVRITVFKDLPGALLKHANDLPLTDGIDIETILECHNFTWNVPYDTFNYYNDAGGHINSIGPVGTACFGCPGNFVYCESISCTENYREVNIPATDDQPSPILPPFHFITLNAKFLIDRRFAIGQVPYYGKSYFEEQYRRVSMHTMERKVVVDVLGNSTATYSPISINARGDYAEAPWPLLSQAKATALGLQFGQAVPYTEMNNVNPETDFHYIEALLPRTTDLHVFINTHGLVIPSN